MFIILHISYACWDLFLLWAISLFIWSYGVKGSREEEGWKWGSITFNEITNLLLKMIIL